MKNVIRHIILIVVLMIVGTSGAFAQPDPPEVPVDGFSLIYLIISGAALVLAKSKARKKL